MANDFARDFIINLNVIKIIGIGFQGFFLLSYLINLSKNLYSKKLRHFFCRHLAGTSTISTKKCLRLDFLIDLKFLRYCSIVN